MNTVFAFGSNMHLKQMFARCPKAKLVGPGILRDYKLSFASFSHRWGGAVATVIQSPGKRCYGLLFELPDRDLVALDGFEGGGYERFTVPIMRSGGGRPRRSFAYRLKDTWERPAPPSSSYLGVIWDAYREWGFDAGALAEAIEESCRGKEHLRGARSIAQELLAMGRRKTC